MIQPGELKVGASVHVVRGALWEWHVVDVRVVSFDDETACVHGTRLGVNHYYDCVDDDDFDSAGRHGRICFAKLKDLFLDEIEAANEAHARIRQSREITEMVTRVHEEAGTDGIDL